jgi:hypothetical protein
MNDTFTSDSVEHRWVEAVKNYVPRVLAKWKELGCLQEGIRELRRKRVVHQDYFGPVIHKKHVAPSNPSRANEGTRSKGTL